MTIASKTVLVQMRFVRAGAPFADVTAKASIDTSDISGYTYRGSTFFGSNAEITPPTYPSSTAPVRRGAPYNEVTTKATYDASFGQGRTRQGVPFVVRFAGTSIYPAMQRVPIRRGAPYSEVVAKSTINASEFDVTRQGAPFWVATGYRYNQPQFFIMF